MPSAVPASQAGVAKIGDGSMVTRTAVPGLMAVPSAAEQAHFPGTRPGF